MDQKDLLKRQERKSTQVRKSRAGVEVVDDDAE
jgi:hypothetical protein